ncbi:MAG: type I restriction enzyme M protein, partial [Lentisphaeria bacterium]
KESAQKEYVAKAAALQADIENRNQAIANIDKQLESHSGLEQALKNLKAVLKDTEKKRDDLVEAAREKITPEEAKALIEARFRQELEADVQAYIRAFTTDIIKCVENLHDKYAVTVKQILAERDQQVELLDGYMRELGYE